jgi:hypothetical protein
MKDVEIRNWGGNKYMEGRMALSTADQNFRFTAWRGAVKIVDGNSECAGKVCVPGRIGVRIDV